MQLYLVQHGEAVAKEIDKDRPLSQKGLSDVNHLATFLNQAGIKPSSIIHSGKTRARQTAEAFADVMGIKEHVQAVSGINPNDTVGEFITQLENYNNDSMIIGHLPFMAKLVSQLVNNKSDPAITAFLPGSVVCLTRENDMSWQIAWMLRPELINN